MNEKTELKKKLLKQALSKNHNRKEELLTQQTVEKFFQREQIGQKPIHNNAKTLQLNFKGKTQGYVQKKDTYKFQEQFNSINHEISLYTRSQNFSQKPSDRSSFSQSLYTEETENIKIMISRVFEKKNFVQELQSSLDKNVKLKSKQEFADLQEKLSSNEVFVLSLEARLREKKGRERQDFVEREVKKKVTRLILLNQNQKECYNLENGIQNFLEQKLRKIKRKQN